MTVQELSEATLAERLEELRSAERGASPAALQGDSASSPSAPAGAAALEGGAMEWEPPMEGPTPLSIHQALGEFASTNDASLHARTSQYRYVKPLIEAADSLIDYLQNTDGRFLLGLREIDIMTRGFGPGELIYCSGYTHSGKTQLVLSAILNNLDKRMLVISGDEPSELVLTKLVCMLTRSNAERMEERVKAGDQEAVNRIRRYAREDLRNLVVVDQTMTRNQMSDTVKEAEDYFGQGVDALVLDYLELFARADGCDVEEGSQRLKGWAMTHEFPTICIHQGSRGHSGGGQELKMNAMKYGGEQEAIVLLGVRRQRDNEDLDGYERQRHENTVSVSVIKNKRPPSKRGEADFYMDPDCGLVLPLDRAPHAPVAAKAPAGRFPGQRNFDGEES